MDSTTKSSQVMGPLYGVVEKFEGKHYMLWKFKMETLLKARELWGPIDDTEVKPQGDAIALLAYTKRQNKALNFLVQSLSNNQLMTTIRKEKTTKGIWDTLAKHLVDQGLVTRSS